MPETRSAAARHNSQTTPGGGDIAPSARPDRVTRSTGRGDIAPSARPDRVTRSTGRGDVAPTCAQANRVTRSAGRGGRRGGTRGGHHGTMDREMQPVADLDNDSFYDDPGHGEKLQARNGCLGTVSSRGWEARTNFLIDVYALINSSSTYKLKGRSNKLNPIKTGSHYPLPPFVILFTLSDMICSTITRTPSLPFPFSICPKLSIGGTGVVGTSEFI